MPPFAGVFLRVISAGRRTFGFTRLVFDLIMLLLVVDLFLGAPVARGGLLFSDMLLLSSPAPDWGRPLVLICPFGCELI